jgi:hypothetical protein
MRTIMMAFGAAILLGLASTALAIAPLGVSKDREVARDSGLAAYTQTTSRAARSDAPSARSFFVADEIVGCEGLERPE